MADVLGFRMGNWRFLVNHGQGIEGYERCYWRKEHFE